MNKTRFISLLFVIASLFFAPEVGAQNFGNLLKKVIEKFGTSSSKKSGTINNNNLVMTQVPEVTVINPLARFINVEPEGLFAYSENEFFGKAYLVLRVTNFTEKESVCFGSGIQNKKMIAVDPSGNILNVDASGGYRLDCPTDITVNIVLDQESLQFDNVARNIAFMPMVTLGINIDAYRQGNLTFKNVPVFWDELPQR